MHTRTEYAYREAMVSIVGNILIAAMKIGVGTLVSSASIIADGVHSISDIGTSIVVIFGAKASEKPPDEEHPFGHGRYEYIASFTIYIFLIAVAFEIFIGSLGRLLSGESPDYGTYLIPVYVVLIISMLGKELMARYSFSLAEKSGNTMLHGDGWHHRSDALTTVAVLIGVVMVQYGILWADAAISMVISLFIGYTGVKMAIETSAILAGKNASPEELEKIGNAAMNTDGVLGVHDIHVHDYGRYRSTTLHIEVASGMSAESAHSLADNVEKRVSSITEGDVLVHVDPVSDTRAMEAEKRLARIIESRDEVLEYHNMQRQFRGNSPVLSVHLVMRRDMSLEEAHRVIHAIDSDFRRDFPEYTVDIHPDPQDR